jgi:DNA-binding HxlR family transcriptional regulator
VVGVLSKGPIRFNALLRLIGGVSHRMLTLAQRGLEQDALVRRTVYPTVPHKVEYELTAVGRSLIEPLNALSEWAHTNQPAIQAARSLSGAENADADLAQSTSHPVSARFVRRRQAILTATNAIRVLRH